MGTIDFSVVGFGKCDAGIGDVTSQEKGSGARFNAGKPDYSLMPMWCMDGVAQVWMYGQKKYAAWNWAKGMPWSAPYASLMRHLIAWQQGIETDEESGLHHLDHAMCNLLMLKHYTAHYPEGDDRPKHLFATGEHK